MLLRLHVATAPPRALWRAALDAGPGVDRLLRAGGLVRRLECYMVRQLRLRCLVRTECAAGDPITLTYTL